MYARSLVPPRGSFFLFGPRGTGKSTWAKASLEHAHLINLLPPAATLRYERDPSLFRAEVLTRSRTEWIVVDEVQRVPGLLDEVHFLMEEHDYRKFALTGSSARKLKRGQANLLAGRAVVKKLYPLTTAELDFSVPVTQLLRFGSLPLSVNAVADSSREEFLRAYVTMYLSEEVKAESLVRNLGGFSRFLEVAALAAGQVTNVSNLARDAAVARDTVRGYFDVLVDTLIGTWLPAYRPRARVKEVAHPKFYWFDTGVLNAAAGAFDQPPPSDWTGVLLEHLIHHELRSHAHYSSARGTLGYWSTQGGNEVDFVWWHGDRITAIEVKHATRYRSEFRRGIEALESTARTRSFVVYRGDRELHVEGTRVVPVETFLRMLHQGDVLR